jgi:diguanylate cyclase (GGDEF)-like protein
MYLILLTGRASRLDLIAGLEAGADDYMVKPLHPDELRARVKVGARVASLQESLAARVSELQTVKDDLTRLVRTDALTRVHARGWWFEVAQTEMSRAHRYNRALSVLVLDLDFFKQVNDTYGHDSGDRLLRSFAEMLGRVCRDSDVIGRLGGEEFAILVPETPLASAEVLAGRITDGCRAMAVSTPGGVVRTSCSIGLTAIETDDATIEAALRRADSALYAVKRNGRDGWQSCRAGVTRAHGSVRS